MFARRFALLRRLIEGLDEEALGWRPREVAAYRDRIGVADLTEIRARPARNQEFRGIQVLLNNYGHLVEHMAQIAMTRQLCPHQL